MSVKSFGNPASSFRYRFGGTGNRVRPIIPFSASGGTTTAAGITPGNGYRYHVFTSPGTFTVTSGSKDVEYLVVAGGGGGGTGTGGGGGAGGVRNGTVSVSSPQPITVGPATPTAAHGSAAVNGNPSSFGPITSQGGGRGASGSLGGTLNVASPGGSGGGGGFYPGSYMPGALTGGTGNRETGTSTPAPTQGNDGGTLFGGEGGSGGGGAGSIGSAGPAGAGGSGSPYPAFAAPLISSEIPAPVQPTWTPAVGPTGLYGGGGGGSNTSAGGAGGPGGGGAGNPSNSSPGSSGVNYTGGGGGANWSYSPGNVAGAGGAGIVIIRYSI